MNEPASGMLADVQSQPAAIPIRINRTGIRGLKMPILVRQRDCPEPQRTVAEISLGVDVSPDFRGAHMSRFVETLDAFNREAAALDYSVALRLMRETCERLHAQRAHLSLSFPYFLMRQAPVSGIPALMTYDCNLACETDGKKSGKVAPFTLSVTVPVMTVCPCSLAISEQGAHSQRAEIRLQVRLGGHVWIEDLIDMAERAGSSPVYTLLKRADEKFVTENAFAQTRFVEDVARHAAAELAGAACAEWWSVEVESAESIHAHNAFAFIEGGPEADYQGRC